MSCFMGQNPTVPVYRGEIQTRNLGMAVEAWSPDGKCVPESVCACVCASELGAELFLIGNGCHLILSQMSVELFHI